MQASFNFASTVMSQGCGLALSAQSTGLGVRFFLVKVLADLIISFYGRASGKLFLEVLSVALARSYWTVLDQGNKS